MSDGTFDMGVAGADRFDALVEAKIAAANADRASGEPQGVAAPAEKQETTARERDGKGRFATRAEAEQAGENAEPTAEAEPTPSDEDEGAAEQEAVELSPEASELEELRRRLIEKDEFIGRQSSELGDLRRLAAQIASDQTRIAQQTRPQVDMLALTDQIAERPALGETYATQAIQAGDWESYDAVLDAWSDVDPRAARRYDRHVNSWIASQQAAAQTAPLHQDARQSATKQAISNVSGRYEDFVQVLQGMKEVPPVLAHALEHAPDASTYESALDTLYHYGKSVQTGPLKEATRKAVQEAERDGRQAKVEATVASAAASPVRGQVKKPGQVVLEEMLALDEPYANPWSRI